MTDDEKVQRAQELQRSAEKQAGEFLGRALRAEAVVESIVKGAIKAEPATTISELDVLLWAYHDG